MLTHTNTHDHIHNHNKVKVRACHFPVWLTPHLRHLIKCLYTCLWTSVVSGPGHPGHILSGSSGSYPRLKWVLSTASLNIDDDARVDIRASGFWRCLHHHTFFDVRVFNCFAASNRSSTLSTAFRKHELEKRRAYEERIREVEHGSLPPLFFPLQVTWEGLPPPLINILPAC